MLAKSTFVFNKLGPSSGNLRICSTGQKNAQNAFVFANFPWRSNTKAAIFLGGLCSRDAKFSNSKSVLLKMFGGS